MESPASSPSPASMVQKRTKAPNMRPEQEKFFVAERLQRESEFKRGEIHRDEWNDIAVNLNKEFPLLPQKTGAQLENRWKALLKKYKEERSASTKSGAAPSSWDFYKAFDELYDTRVNITYGENLVTAGLTAAVTNLPLSSTQRVDVTAEDIAGEPDPLVQDMAAQKRRSSVTEQAFERLQSNHNEFMERLTAMEKAQEERAKRKEALLQQLIDKL